MGFFVMRTLNKTILCSPMPIEFWTGEVDTMKSEPFTEPVLLEDVSINSPRAAAPDKQHAAATTPKSDELIRPESMGFPCSQAEFGAALASRSHVSRRRQRRAGTGYQKL